jgi:hypothetical protein
MMADNLGPQFLYHGTDVDIKDDQILPAKVHGGESNWGDTGSSYGEPSNEHAWAHPSEAKTWEFAKDRVNYHYGMDGDAPGRRARVFAVKPNEQMTPGGRGVAGEYKAPHFDIAHPIDIQPGHQGTFPEVNWNKHALDGGHALPGEGDANHPTDDEVKYGHRHGAWAGQGEQRIRQDARNEDDAHYLRSLSDRNIAPRYRDNRDQPLPGMMNERQFTGRR